LKRGKGNSYHRKWQIGGRRKGFRVSRGLWNGLGGRVSEGGVGWVKKGQKESYLLLGSKGKRDPGRKKFFSDWKRTAEGGFCRT